VKHIGEFDRIIQNSLPEPSEWNYMKTKLFHAYKICITTSEYDENDLESINLEAGDLPPCDNYHELFLMLDLYDFDSFTTTARITSMVEFFKTAAEQGWRFDKVVQILSTKSLRTPPEFRGMMKNDHTYMDAFRFVKERKEK